MYYVYAATQITLTLRHSHARQMGLALKKKGHHVITHRLIKFQIANLKITIENWKVWWHISAITCQVTSSTCQVFMLTCQKKFITTSCLIHCNLF